MPVPDLYVGGRWQSARCRRDAARSAARPTARSSPRSTRPTAEDTDGRDRGRPRGLRRRARGRTSPRASAATCCARSPTCWSATRTPSRGAESLDTGKRLVESEYDVDDVVGVFRHYGELAAEDAGRVVDTGSPDVVSRDRARAVGVCGLITPWNYPLLQTVLEGRALPGRGQHLRAQAERAHAAHRDPADAAARRGRASRRRRQPGARRRPERGRAAVRRTRASTWSPSPAASRPAGAIMAAAAPAR